jgi:hypothetical protein
LKYSWLLFHLLLGKVTSKALEVLAVVSPEGSALGAAHYNELNLATQCLLLPFPFIPSHLGVLAYIHYDPEELHQKHTRDHIQNI